MKKIFYLIILSLFFIPFLNVKAVSSDDVDYTITNYYIQSDIDIAGSLNVKELIVLSGSYNGYVRELKWTNSNLPKFTGKDSDFEGSDIYNGSEAVKLKVGTIDISKNTYDDLFNKVTYFKEAKGSNGDKGKFEVTKNSNGADIKMYNAVENGQIGFYLEYTIPNLAVKHNDVAELYYNFIGEDFVDDIDNVEIRTFLPEADKSYRIWAHGPLNGTIYKTKDNTGSVLKTTDLPANTPVDVRMTYDKELLPICLYKNTKVEALPKILKVEKQRANEANAKRERAKAIMLVIKIISIIYILGAIILIIYLYQKYDKEYKSNFKGKYFRNEIEDYSPEVVEYLMTKKVGSNALNSSLLNLIRKKNIEVEKTDKKNEYIFSLKSNKNLSKSEQNLIELLFDFVGDGKIFNTKDLKKKAKENSGTTNLFYEKYTSWKDEVEMEGINQEFYQEETKPKLIGIPYGILGLAILVFSVWFDFITIYTVLTLPAALVIILYVVTMKKRSVKGNEDYTKWKAYKNYLEDFGRFDEKELPEVKLWEKLLVYAAVFGIADKVGKSMKTKFDEMHPNYDYNNNTLFLPYYFGYGSFLGDIDHSLSSTLSTAQTAQTQLSSGSGAGGGFSGGGGFGGGGGGGHGF